jgi:hypothetical protein
VTTKGSDQPTKEPVERRSPNDVETKDVTVKATGGYTLPSGAQYLLHPGDALSLRKEDAQFLLDNDLAE